MRVEKWVRAGKGVLLFMHVHNGGGSTACNMARPSGMRIPTPETSGSWVDQKCNPHTRDKYRSWQAWPDDMVEYAVFILSRTDVPEHDDFTRHFALQVISTFRVQWNRPTLAQRRLGRLGTQTCKRHACTRLTDFTIE